MKIPETPPQLNLHPAVVGERNLLDYRKLTDEKGRYLHWEKLKRLTPPEGFTPLDWWTAIKIARKGRAIRIPLQAKNGARFYFTDPAQVQKQLHWLTQNASGAISGKVDLLNKESEQTFLMQALFDEAIYSSQLEGAATTREKAKEMLQEGRAPRDHSERMIANNYAAMAFIRERLNEPLTPKLIFDLHRIVTKETLGDSDHAGRFRQPGEPEIVVVDRRDDELLHTPPPPDQLPGRLKALCHFANSEEEEGFVHPLVKGIILHFMIGYDHPFSDGNGRTARALFYWYALKAEYWLVSYISLSEIIKQAPAQYSKAYLHTETDEGDMTYFVIHQLDALRAGIDRLTEKMKNRMADLQEIERLLEPTPTIRSELNFRQIGLLRHALRHPGNRYTIAGHSKMHGMAINSARNDLLKLADGLGFLDKNDREKKLVFIAPGDLVERIRRGGGER